MTYLGSKRRIAKEILAIMLKNRQPEQYFVDVFCGGCNVIKHVDGNRIANDLNKYLIGLLVSVVYYNWKPKSFYNIEEYKDIRDNKEKYHPATVGFVGFIYTWGTKFFSCYVFDRNDRDGSRREKYITTTERFNDTVSRLNGVQFECGTYDELELPPNSILYCDPPYKDTAIYRGNGKDNNHFDHIKFYDWCRKMHSEGHKVYVSEFYMPKDFTVVWSKKTTHAVSASISADRNTTQKIVIEKLYTLI